MDKVKWKVNRTETTKLGRFETILETLEHEDGKEGYYSYVRFAKLGVCILPILESGEIVIIEQYRRPFDKWLYELPAGTVDHDEKPQETVKRELQEETGYIAKDIISSGYFYPSPGSTNEQIFLFAVHCGGHVPAKPEKTEHIHIMKINPEGIRSFLQQNRIQHGAAVILLQKYLLNEFN